MPELSATFVTHAASILADTNSGLSGQQIVTLTTAYALDWHVELPVAEYPFPAGIPNKRTALFQNLMAFSEVQRYRIIRDLCDRPTLNAEHRSALERLKTQLVASFGYLAPAIDATQVDSVLVEATQHWLGAFPDALGLYQQAVMKYGNKVFARNVLDDLRLALEVTVKRVLQNDKSLENQLALLGTFIKSRGGSAELANMFLKLLDYYTKYQNSYVKHDDAVVEEGVEFIFEITSSFMKHLIRLSARKPSQGVV